jgi:hypothetical protein
MGAVYAYIIAQIIMFIGALVLIRKIIKIKIAKRNLSFIPAILLFVSGLWLITFLENIILQLALIVAMFIGYLLLLVRINVINKEDLLLMDYFPNKFGLGKIKKFIKNIVP